MRTIYKNLAGVEFTVLENVNAFEIQRSDPSSDNWVVLAFDASGKTVLHEFTTREYKRPFAEAQDFLTGIIDSMAYVGGVEKELQVRARVVTFQDIMQHVTNNREAGFGYDNLHPLENDS